MRPPRRRGHETHHCLATHTHGVRHDLFTNIHKGLRLGLSELIIEAGRTDWADAHQVGELGRRWHALLDVLRVHTDHEDRHVFALLDGHGPQAVEPARDAHHDLDDLLGDLAGRFEATLAHPDPVAGLELYRDLNLFVAAYLPHLHQEETQVMRRIWECCSDDEIAACRARLMADTTSPVGARRLAYLLAAVDRPTRLALARGMAGAPPAAIARLGAIADDVLDAEDAAQIRAVLAG